MHTKFLLNCERGRYVWPVFTFIYKKEELTIAMDDQFTGIEYHEQEPWAISGVVNMPLKVSCTKARVSANEAYHVFTSSYPTSVGV